MPRTFARTGVVGNSFFLAQWFPKLGVLEDGGWNTHQFHAATEFFSDYGVYDVRMTVPRGWVVGATGVERSRTDTPTGKTVASIRAGGRARLRLDHQPGLHRQDREVRAQAAAGASRCGCSSSPSTHRQAERYFMATRATLRSYGEWYGPYPYGHITIVDPALQS